QEELLVGVLGVELGHRDTAEVGAVPGRAGRADGGGAGGRGVGEVARAELGGGGDVLHPGDVRRGVDQLAGAIGGGEDDRAGAVGAGRAVVPTQRVGHVRLGEQVLLVAAGRAGGARGHLRLGPAAGVDAGAGLQGGDVVPAGPQRGDRV